MMMMLWTQGILSILAVNTLQATAFVSPVRTTTAATATATTTSPETALYVSTDSLIGTPTELPDSLDDGAEIAAQACADFAETAGPCGRCRIDFDTSVGDETYTILKTSTEFMQKLVTSICYLMIPGVQQRKQQEMMRMSQARAELRALGEPAQDDDQQTTQKRDQLVQILRTQGVDPQNTEWTGPIARIYFPDEGNAALARRDWAGEGLVPPCVAFSSCGGVQSQNDVTNDHIIFFFCPKASESESVEELLLKTEQNAPNLKLTIFVNPNLVDMGVTGFGMAGRLLRERLIEPLTHTYYLRTLQWGALTRVWPRDFSIWQEDENAEGGYRLIQTQNKLPSNPEVEDIYDMENGLMDQPKEGFGFLNALGDFVNGMTKL